MKLMMTEFSIIIPTYTGQDHIKDCFDSILSQDDLSSLRFNIIVVIDGPNSELRQIVDNQQNRFKAKKIDFQIYQFKKNMGRFEARLKGARESKNKYILFLDDRNTLATDYLKEVIKADKKALIPNVLERDHPQFVAKTMYLLRSKIYGRRWGRDFPSYEITKENFEKSSKGTTSFWVEKGLFVLACREVGKNHIDLKAISDDTKVMRFLVENNISIYRSSEAKIYYQPRKSARAELLHIFNRGPIFIDYYLRPGTRFFAPLILFYITIMMCLILVFTVPSTLLALFVMGITVALLVSVYITGSVVLVASVFVGLILIVISFGLGLLKGLTVKLLQLKKVVK